MSKTYKGYELYKMIAEGEIKEGTKFKNLSTCEVIVFDGENLKNATSNEYLSYMFDDIKLVTLDFELIEDGIEESNLQQKSFEEIGEAVGEMYLEFMKGLANAIKQDINKEDKQCIK